MVCPHGGTAVLKGLTLPGTYNYAIGLEYRLHVRSAVPFLGTNYLLKYEVLTTVVGFE